MNLYRNLKMRTKYFIPISFIVFGFLLVVFYGIKTLNTNSNNFIDFINKDQTLLLSLNNMYAQGLQSEQATRNVLLNPADQKAKENYNKANDDFHQQFQLAQKSVNGNSDVLLTLRQLESLWLDLDALKKKVQDLATSDQHEAGILLLAKTETPKWREFKKVLLDLIAKKEHDISLKGINIQESANNAFVTMISFSIFIVVISFIIIFLAAKAFVKPISFLETSARKVASGDTDVAIEIVSNDEFGSLAKSFNIMVENIRASLYEARQKGVIAESAANEAELAKKISNMQSEYLSVSVKKILVEMEKFANGDLNTHLTIEKDDEIGRLYTGFNKAVQNIKTMIHNVSESVVATVSAASQISSSSEIMAAGVQEQSQQTTEVAGAVEEMTKTILETTKNSASASEAAKNAGTSAKEGGKVVAETIEGMNRIADVVKKSAETVLELGKSSNQIGEIIQVIDDIADQTNLLALNAAIEAARAGEQGRGFAVVADEVRKLAERTTKATKEIAGMIKQIQKDTRDAVESMGKGTEEVKKGKALADKAGVSLEEIILGAEKVVDIITQVAAASEEQSSTSEEISKNIEMINNVTQESASGISLISKASDDLSRLTLQLQELISEFKMNDSTDVWQLDNR